MGIFRVDNISILLYLRSIFFMFDRIKNILKLLNGSEFYHIFFLILL